jgi:hypothetical protein
VTIATDLATALATDLGPAEDRIHTALPPIGVGGGADVLEFRGSSEPGGVVWVSAGASAHQRPEIVVCTRAPADWAPGLVSKLAAASLQRRFAWGGSLPLGDGPFAGLLFTSAPGLRAITIEKRWTSFLLAVGLQARELAACRTHGTPHVVEILRAAGALPFSDPSRAEAPGIATLGPSALAREGLSPRARDGLRAVVYGMSEEVEALRRDLTPRDLEILAEAYGDLGALHQRAELVHLVGDSLDDRLTPLYRAYLRDAGGAQIDEGTGEHASLATALCAMERDWKRFDVWFDDLAAAQRRARELSG